MSTDLQRDGGMGGVRWRGQTVSGAKNLDVDRSGAGRPLARTLLHGDVDGAGVGGLQQLLVRLSSLIEELHQQGARLLVLAPPDGGQLIQLLLHQSCVVQGILQTVPAGWGAEAGQLVTCTQKSTETCTGLSSIHQLVSSTFSFNYKDRRIKV